MIYLASIPRSGSTYLLRCICGLPQGGNTPPGAQEEHGIVKTHHVPDEEPRLDWSEGDRAVFLFGDVAASVLSTQRHRHDPNHFANCGVTDYDPDADLLSADLLGYERIWDGWASAPFPVLFIRYEAMEDPVARNTIERWVRRPIQWLPWRERRTEVEGPVRDQIENAYRGLVKKVKAAGPITVMHGGRT